MAIDWRGIARREAEPGPAIRGVQWRPVSSTCLVKIGYDASRHELHVQFQKSFAYYTYHEVPGYIHERMMAAASKGRFLNYRIKGHYSYTKGSGVKGASRSAVSSARGRMARPVLKSIRRSWWQRLFD